ncbi:hypothetical protein [Bifidobacterium adolescentis]|uniref:hypothetical protein n=1 Tax=Bifidobacterium adolescentis TaxID=1680 RepID=UPI00189AB325|nr:hypothetical protein [Bifidobacterium adolescentis]MDB1503079.1 hypothetical protein [Bifidobacterium adolescentis]
MEDNVTSDAVKDHPAGTGRNGKRVIVGVAAAVAVVLAVGGVCGYRAWEDHRVSVARGACGSAAAAQKKAVDSYRTLLGADATTAALKTDVKAVKDAKTLDALKRAVGAETPTMVKCDASDKTGLDEATAKADKTARSVKADAKTLQAAVRAVESSKLDKTVDDADGLYRATEGKVQDDKTRDALKQAIAKRDADAIAKAVRAVNDSKTAKDQADAEAAAKAQAEQAAAAQQAQQQAQRSYSYGSYSSGGWSGSAGGRSYSGGSYSGGSQGGYSSNAGSSSSSSASDNIHYDWEDNTGDQYNCQPDKFCPLG